MFGWGILGATVHLNFPDAVLAALRRHASRSAFAFTLLLAAAPSALGVPRAFQNHNCAIDLPSSWTVLDPAPSGTLIAAHSSDGSKTFILNAIRIPPNELAGTVQGMLAGAERAAKEQGWEISDARGISLGGVNFHILTVHMSPGASAVVYAGLAGNEAYQMKADSILSVADADSELTQIVDSFRLLAQPNIQPVNEETKSVAYRTGYVLGIGAVIACILWVIRQLRGGSGAL